MRLKSFLYLWCPRWIVPLDVSLSPLVRTHARTHTHTHTHIHMKIQNGLFMAFRIGLLDVCIQYKNRPARPEGKRVGGVASRLVTLVVQIHRVSGLQAAARYSNRITMRELRSSIQFKSKKQRTMR